MKFSAKAQYACVAMVELACSHGAGRPVHLKDIAAQNGISPRFLVQLLLQLTSQALVESTRGAAGGYHLARSPDGISLADILHAVDPAPPPSPSALHALSSTPAVEAVRCILHGEQLRQEQRLAEITLADLARRAQRHSEVVYQI